MNIKTAAAKIRELGHVFAVAMTERGHPTDSNDLFNGLAAYDLLYLTGVSPDLDRAHDLVMREITELVYDRLRAA